MTDDVKIFGRDKRVYSSLTGICIQDRTGPDDERVPHPDSGPGLAQILFHDHEVFLDNDDLYLLQSAIAHCRIHGHHALQTFLTDYKSAE